MVSDTGGDVTAVSLVEPNASTGEIERRNLTAAILHQLGDSHASAGRVRPADLSLQFPVASHVHGPAS
jgi:hypothetical protein